MKIISVIICIYVALSMAVSFAEEDCSYLEGAYTTKSFDNAGKCWFWAFYNAHLCREFQPITEEAIAYVQAIKKSEGKTVRELVTDMGNTLCRWVFGTCWENAFADRYKKACDIAREKTIDDALKCQGKNPNDKNERLIISSNDKSFQESYIKCLPLSETLLDIFKDVSEQEIGKYHGKIIESSSAQYLAPSRDLMQNLSNTMGSIIKKIWSVARSFEWFIRNVYNTWFTIGNGGH